MDIDINQIKELVNKTFGQEAANDQDIVDFYQQILCNIFESVFVIQADFGHDEPYQIIGIALSSGSALQIRNSFENQMRLTKAQPAPYSAKDFEAGKLTDTEAETYAQWHFDRARADSFNGCQVKSFKLDQIYDLGEPKEKEFFPIKKVDFKEKPDFLVRPSDFTVFSKQTNGKYRIDISDIPEQRGSEYEYEVLKSHNFFPCTQEELPDVKKKHDFHYAYLKWAYRSDGHGGSKGGTIEEYKEYLRSKES